MTSLDPGRRWWTQRWLEVIEHTGASMARRVQRGQALARRGAVGHLRVEPGRVRAEVVDDQPGAHRVELSWPVPSDRQWATAVQALAGELRFTAGLLDGDLPETAQEALADAGLALIPGIEDVALNCSCDQRPQPCRHAVAVWTAVAVVFDRDIFALLRLRGRGRDELLDGLRLRRGVAPAQPVGANLDLSRGLETAHDELGAIELHPSPVADPASLLRQLGEPPGVDDERTFERLVERAAATAWRLAAGDGSQAADEELLLAELRAQRVGSAASLAEALGREVEAVRAELDRLYADGTVMRTGSGDGARYRASAS